MMAIRIRTPESILSTFKHLGPGVLSTDNPEKYASVVSPRPDIQAFIDPTPYPESTARWLVDLLELLISVVDRNQDINRFEITESEYKQLSSVMNALIYSVAEDETHPLSAAMTFVGMLMKGYEDEHFPPLADIFPELAAGGSVEPIDPLPTHVDTDFVALVFFSIGCLLWNAGERENAIAAYSKAVDINPNYVPLYASRAEAKAVLNNFTGAKADLQRALETVEASGEDALSIGIKARQEEIEIMAAAVAYLSEPRFAKFSILREPPIQIGKFRSRADIVLCDSDGHFRTIVECKLSTFPNYNQDLLKSYLCATDTPFGILATHSDKTSWVFYENLRHNQFRQIERSDFERKIFR